MSALTVPAPTLTPAVLPAAPTPPAPVVPSLYRISVAQYHQMLERGILTTSDRVELLEGLLVIKMSINPPHRRGVRKLMKALEAHAPVGWYEDAQQPITLDTSEPEPDGMLIRGNPDDYVDRHPDASEIGVVAEVSQASLDQDRVWKKRIYARIRIPVYWIINLIDRHVEVYTDPTGPADQPDYRNHQDFGPADAVPLVLDGKEVARIPVSDLLP